MTSLFDDIFAGFVKVTVCRSFSFKKSAKNVISIVFEGFKEFQSLFPSTALVIADSIWFQMPTNAKPNLYAKY